MAGLCHSGFTQSFLTKVYTAADGLPDGNVSSIYQDSKGYLWLGTRTSLCRFNGREFVNYGKELGNSHITGSMVLEDRQHRYWIYTKDGIAQVKDKQMSYQPTSDRKKVGWLFSITQFQDGRIWMMTDKGIYQFEDSVWQKQIPVKENSGQPCRYAVETPKGIYLNYGDQLFLYQKGGKSKAITPRQKESPYYIWLKQYNGKTYVNTVEGMYRIVDDSLVRIFKNQINGVYSFDFLADSKHRMWVSTEKDGIMVSDPDNETDLPHKILLPFNQTLLFTEDGEGNIWASNYEGLVKMQDAYLEVFDKQKNSLLTDMRHLTIKPDGHLLIKSTSNGFIAHSNQGFVADQDFATANRLLANTLIDASAFDATGVLWAVTRSGNLLRVDRSGVIDCNKTVKDEIFQYVTADPLTQTIYVCGKKLYTISHDTLVPFSDNSVARIINPRRVYRSHQQTIVYTRDSGVYLVLPAGEARHLAEIPASNFFYNDFRLINDPDGGFWTTSFDEGLQKWTWDRNQVPVLRYSLSVNNGLPNNLVIASAFDKTGRLWLATLSGMAVIEKTVSGNYTVNRIDEEPIAHFGNWAEAELVRDSMGAVWLSSFHQLIRFNTDRLYFDKNIPRVAISNVQLNLQPTDWSSWTDSLEGINRLPLYVSLPHNRNTISISFDAISFSHNEQCLFSYRLDGLDTAWQSPTTTRSVSFASLAPGSYSFRVKVRKPNTDWSSEARFAFFIRQPFWTTWWFQLLVILFSVAVIAWFVRLRIRRIRDKVFVQQQLQDLEVKALKTANALMAAKQKMADSEMQALRAQMNPHFIYNALNSIQSLVLDERLKEAIRYIGKFARLLRQVLEHSDNNLITLEKELSALELYIQLEALRLNAELHYEIEVDDQIMPEKELLPPLIIQPYVENALWHGLSRKTGERQLKVDVSANEDWLFVKIRDNGIGRQEAAAHKKQTGVQTASKGMDITANRLSVLNEGAAIQAVQVLDLVDEEGLPSGTEVTLHIRRFTKA